MTFPQIGRLIAAMKRIGSAIGLVWSLPADTILAIGRRLRAIPARARIMLMLGLCSVSVVAAQAGAASDEDVKESEEGIPVTSKLVIEKCAGCHAPDDKGNLTRISWVRTTPEGWSQAISRMVKLNGLQITPAETREILKYLSAYHGLAPSEAKPVMYMPEERTIEEKIPTKTLHNTCASCHAFGKPMSWRRSKAEWKLLRALHVSLYSQAESQYNQPLGNDDEDEGGSAGSDAGYHQAVDADGAAPKKKKTRGDVAFAEIAKLAPLHTPEWAAWRARIRSPQLAGKWMVSAVSPTKGQFIGEMTVAPSGAADEFKTSVTLRSLSDGTTLTRTGAAIVYGGYSWRGRSQGGAAKGAAPTDLSSEAHEAMWFSPDQASAEGRWFWGAYNEFGFDVKLTRVAGAPVIGGVAPGTVKAGTKGVTFHILGDSLPTSLAAGDVSLGAGVTVTKIVSASAGEVVVTADVAADAPAGLRDVAVQGATLEKAFPVYRKVDYLKVTPETALARLGGSKYPKGYQLFEAVGYDNGADGKPNTADDVATGPVAATWSIDEFMTVTYDDDKKYVGTIDAETGLFTPNEAGPNPERRFGRNNYGEVWVVATAKTLKAKDGKPLSARAYLVTTVPMYRRWEQPEIAP